MQSVTTSLAGFTAAATLLTITPGLDTALVLRTAASHGPRSAALSGMGIATGCLAWTLVVAVGLGTLLEASQIAYTVLRWIGAAYLCWLGINLLRHPRQTLLVAPSGASSGAAFVKGALTNLLNPKVGIFYVSFLPQFVPQSVPITPFILLLGAIHAALGLLWFALLIVATRPIARVLRRPAVLRALDRVTGGVFLVFGVGLALDSRRL